MANIELEALVGHLFVVGGRAISAASPGSIAMPPPRRAVRGRQNDTLFGLITLSVGEHQPAAFYEQLSETVTDTFFGVSGSITAALRKVIDAAHLVAQQVNAGRDAPLEVGLICAILREQEIYLAAVGPARCLLAREGFIERLPDTDEMIGGLVGMGNVDPPDVQFYRREIRAGDFLLLTDASFDRLTDQTLRYAIGTGEVNDALNNLAGVAAENSAAEIIKFVLPLADGEVDTIPTRARRSPRLSQFGARTKAPAEEPPEMPDLPASPASAPGPSTAPAQPETPQAGASAPVYKTPPKHRLQQAAHNMMLKMAEITDGARTLVERMLPDEEEKSKSQGLQLSSTMQIGVMIAVAILVALITTAVYKLWGETLQYAQLVRSAQAEIELAVAGGDDQAAARPHWEIALTLLDQAGDIRELSPEIGSMQAAAMAALDSYDHVTRVTTVELRTYAPGALLRGPVVKGLNLYTIDTTNDILYREDLDDTGISLVNREPQIVTRQGEVVDNQVVGGLIDLTWMAEGGVAQQDVLAVLSRNGLLLTYSPSWDITAVLLPGFEAWVDPRAIAVYDRDLYVLDAGANEIWRYAAGDNDYRSAPLRYFTDVVPDLTDAVDMEIDTNGNVYVVHGSGTISKYYQGRPVTFELFGMPQPLARPTAMFLNLSLYDRTLYIADAGGGRLFTTAVNGTFLSNYKDTEDTVFDAISGIYGQDRFPYLYATAGNKVYYFSLP